MPVRRPAIASSGSRLRPGSDRAIAVAPFRSPASDAGLAALAEGLAEDITSGLARFPYLTIIDGAQLGVGEDSGTTFLGRGVRYILRGGLRSAGSELRLSVQLVEVETGAHVWSEAYDRRIEGASLFELQDDLTDRVVATVGDYSGVMARLVAAELRAMDDDEMTVDDWIMRAVCFIQVIHPPEEHAAIRDGLEKMIDLHPDNSEAHAWLANTYANEFAFGFNLLEDPIGRSLQMAQRAVDLDPTTQAGWLNLAGGHFFLGDLAAFEAAATRAMALNPKNSYAIAYMGLCFGNSGQRERGAQLGTQACALNPHHPEWYPFVNFYHHYAREEYEEACSVVKAINWPKFPYTHINFAAACGQLGRPDEARTSIETLRDTFGYDLEAVRDEFLKWGHPEDFVEHILDGLRKAGLDADRTADGALESRPIDGLPVPGKSDSIGIAVLPFADMSPAKDQDYFCEGMAEEIMNALVHVEGIKVASRTSAFRAVEQSNDLKAIGRALSVGQVLEGSVRMAGSRLRVTAQLTEVESGYQLWSERYDREAADVFAVQDEIAAGVVKAVTSRLAPGERKVRERDKVGNLEGYRNYLKARHFRYSKNDHANALRCYEQALALDPSHGPSWVGRAEVTVLAAVYSLIPSRAGYQTAKDALATALNLQGESPEGSYVEGMIAFCEARWRDSEAALRRAIELRPAFVQAHCWLGFLLSVHQRRDEAESAFATACELDPLAPYPYAMTACSYLAMGLPWKGIEPAGQAMTFESDNSLAQYCSGIANVATGEFDEGLKELQAAVRLSRRGPFVLGVLRVGVGCFRETRPGRGGSRRAAISFGPRPDGGLRGLDSRRPRRHGGRLEGPRSRRGGIAAVPLLRRLAPIRSAAGGPQVGRAARTPRSPPVALPNG